MDNQIKITLNDNFNLLDKMDGGYKVEPVDLDMDGGNIDSSEPNLLENVDLSGGAKNIHLTEHFSKLDEKQYEKTLEYIDNYKSKEYSDYIKEYESFLLEKNLASNLKKYKYIETSSVFVKVSIKDNKKNLVVHKPKYAKIDDILEQIKKNIQEVEYKIVVIRDDLLLEKKTKLNFRKLKSEYITLLNQRLIFNNYKNQILRVKERKEERIFLLNKKSDSDPLK